MYLKYKKITTRIKIRQVQKDDETSRFFTDLTSRQEKDQKHIVQEKNIMVIDSYYELSPAKTKPSWKM